MVKHFSLDCSVLNFPTKINPMTKSLTNIYISQEVQQKYGTLTGKNIKSLYKSAVEFLKKWILGHSSS